eukprot:14949546-Alexandrium_andersonii.AAC.1
MAAPNSEMPPCEDTLPAWPVSQTTLDGACARSQALGIRNAHNNVHPPMAYGCWRVKAKPGPSLG